MRLKSVYPYQNKDGWEKSEKTKLPLNNAYH